MAPPNDDRVGPLLALYREAPIARRGMRIGLLGGSFDPPHAGHLHISIQALQRLRLDAVWWLVSPGNPLKEAGPWPLERRLEQCIAYTEHPRLHITAVEARLGSPYTAETLEYLAQRFPGVRFVWLMGGDNLASVHRWRNWRQIFNTMPVAIIDRPETRHLALAGRAAHVFGEARIAERDAVSLAERHPPAWLLLTIPLNERSSTAIRAKYKESKGR